MLASSAPEDGVDTVDEVESLEVCDAAAEMCDAPPAVLDPSFIPQWPQLPFSAWVTTDAANVRREAGVNAPVVGLLHRGDVVQVTDCVPDCHSPGAWGLLNGNSAIRLDVLNLPPQPLSPKAAATQYWRATVAVRRAPIFERPDVRSRVMSRQRLGSGLAFIPNDNVRKSGWLHHTSGGYVRVKDVRFPTPSTLQGEPYPTGPLALLKSLAPLQGPGNQSQMMPKHSRVRALGLGSNRTVLVEGGRLPRSSVALAFHRPRPSSIGPRERWVHVDVNEQVLTAYDGDTWVFATLVSTGKRRTPTRLGIFKVWAKISHTTMRGRGRHPYVVEEVPNILSFHGGQALHQAFWHDHFGYPGTHGCVNLSPADSQWVFDWAPPSLPEGWHTVLTRHAGWGALHVVVEKSPPGSFEVPAPHLKVKEAGNACVGPVRTPEQILAQNDSTVDVGPW